MFGKSIYFSISDKDAKRIQSVIGDGIGKIFLNSVAKNIYSSIGYLVPPKPTRVKYFTRLSINEDVN